MSESAVRFATREEILRITLDRPSRKNALTPESVREIIEHLEGVAKEDSARAVLAAGVVVPADGVVVLFADGDVDQGPLHLPFKLSAAGEGVYLSDPDLKLIDAVEFGPADADTSYARLPDGTGSWHWCVPGTPGQLNGDSC